jgi:hypothetical protein
MTWIRATRVMGAALALAGTGGCGAQPPPRARQPTPAANTVPPTKPAPKITHIVPAGHDGFRITQRGGLALFSRRNGYGGYRLVMQRRGQRVRRLPVRPPAAPLVVDLGTDATGRTVAVFRRCHRGRCTLHRFDPATNREALIPLPLRSRGDGRAPSVHAGRVTFARSGRGPTTIVSAPLDGSSPPVIVERVNGIVRSTDTGDRGLAYAAAPPRDGVHETAADVFFRGRDGRTRVIAHGWSGEEGGTENLTPTFAGRHLVWGVSGSDTNNTYRSHLARVDLVTGRRSELDLPGGALFACAADDAAPNESILVAYDSGGPEGYDPDPARQVLRRVSAGRFRPPHR